MRHSISLVQKHFIFDVIVSRSRRRSRRSRSRRSRRSRRRSHGTGRGTGSLRRQAAAGCHRQLPAAATRSRQQPQVVSAGGRQLLWLLRLPVTKK